MFYGWWIVASVFTAQLFMVGFYTYGYPLIIVPVRAEFEASATEANMIMVGTHLVGIVMPPLVGPLVDRWSARGLMLIGACSLLVALLLLSICQGIYQFIAVFAVLVASANVLLGPIAGSAVVSRWFTVSRGRALGVAAAGTSVGGMALVPAISVALTSWGWRSTLQAIALLVALFVLPLLLFALRNHPSDKGLEPEGLAESAASDGGDALVERAWSNRDILTSRSYWLISCCLGLLLMGYMGVLSNLGLYVEGLEMEMSAVARLISLIALFGLIGKLVLGAATDWLGLRLVLWIALGLAGSGILLLSFEPSYPVMVAAAVSMGLAAGGMLPIWGGMIAAVFGTASFGRAMGLVSPIIAVMVMPSFLIAGASMDATGSFRIAFLIFVGLIGLSALLLFALELPRPQIQEEALGAA